MPMEGARCAAGERSVSPGAWGRGRSPPAPRSDRCLSPAVWLGIMLPVLGIKSLSPYAVAYLDRLLM